MNKIKSITSDKNVIVFYGGKGWCQDDKLEQFLKAGTNLNNYDFEEDQAYFTSFSKDELLAELDKIKTHNEKLTQEQWDNDEAITILTNDKILNEFKWSDCDYEFSEGKE